MDTSLWDDKADSPEQKTLEDFYKEEEEKAREEEEDYDDKE